MALVVKPSLIYLTKNDYDWRTDMKIRTRFAPSPTGKMHVGNLRTGLFAYLIAKHEGGDFLLRIEDTDQERIDPEAVDIIYKTMAATGLVHDEGPDKDGGVGPYVQSDRVKTGIYMKYAKELIEKGEAYYCFCDKERLASLSSTVGEDGKAIHAYDKHCLSLSKEEIEENLNAGKPFVIRQNNPQTGVTTFVDELYGEISVDNSELDDMILIKSDGYPTYNFANVIDDHLMGITHVVRGKEYLSSSPKYNRLYQAFGWEIPTYIHCPLINGEDGKKLSKRHGATSFEDLVAEGYVAEAIVNFVALLGWSPEDNQEIFSLEELVKAFNYKNISISESQFDFTKLKWMNGEYIKNMDFDVFYERALPYIKEAIKKPLDTKLIAQKVKSRIQIFPDIPEMIDFLEEVPENYELELFVNKKNKSSVESSLKILNDVLPLLEMQSDYSNDQLFELLSGYAEGAELKTGALMWPIRIALSGKMVTPAGATEIMEILGKEETISRIKAAIVRLS